MYAVRSAILATAGLLVYCRLHSTRMYILLVLCAFYADVYVAFINFYWTNMQYARPI